MSSQFKVHHSSAAAGDKVGRPFTGQTNGDDGERIATALEYIATALARLDHNFEVLTRHWTKAGNR